MSSFATTVTASLDWRPMEMASLLRPWYSLDTSAGIDLHKTDKLTMTLQADVENLTNRLNVIDFAGVFSGTAVAPPRSCFLRFQTRF